MRPITNITILGARLGVIALVLYWIAIFVGTHLPKMPEFVPTVSDKLKHGVAYFGLGILGCYVSGGTKAASTAGTSRLMIRFAVVMVLGIAYAGIDEWTQGMVPGRTPDWKDFQADVVGLAAALVCYLTLRTLWQSWRQRG
ncbi:VanZ family protein [Stieleria varia]|uniref:VanZ like family protein n=1 Tax=Stieleria varia TaxID=2528005 RepID=A0A5C6ASN6_9BACT|nr:VanZ family protein [Stieleria varia]TWU02289.1 VanZ like family protein [Stieleria varia]